MIFTVFSQIISSIIAASFHIVVGIALSFSAVTVPQLESPDSDIKVTKTETSFVASIIVLMVPIGSIIAGFMMDKIGRINTLKIAALPSLFGLILIATAPNVYWIIAGRIFVGISCAIGTSPAIVYITEVARADLRGSLISSGPTIASFGMILSYLAGAFLNWRILALLSMFFTIFPVVLISIYVPESPVFLVSRGKIEAAAKSLKYLYSRYPQPENTLESLADMHLRVLIRENEKRIADNTQASGKQQSKWAGFRKPTGYKPLVILFFLFLIQQFSGIYITLFFSVTFLQVYMNGNLIDSMAQFIIFLPFFFSLTRISALTEWIRSWHRYFLELFDSSCRVSMRIC